MWIWCVNVGNMQRNAFVCIGRSFGVISGDIATFKVPFLKRNFFGLKTSSSLHWFYLFIEKSQGCRNGAYHMSPTWGGHKKISACARLAVSWPWTQRPFLYSNVWCTDRLTEPLPFLSGGRALTNQCIEMIDKLSCRRCIGQKVRILAGRLEN